MKKFITYMALMAGLCAIALSCTDKDEEIRWVEPGIYYVGKDLNSTNEARTRGITNDYLFDENYDYDYIYLHKISQNESLYIPVHDNCENTEGSPCKGFRYRIEVHEDQSATIIPLDGNGEVYGTKNSPSIKVKNATSHLGRVMNGHYLIIRLPKVHGLTTP